MSSSTGPRRVTAEAVAARAGTSVSTVSLVVNGKDRGRVSAAIRDRVRAAVAELGYVVDHTASALARGRGDLVILVAPDLVNPFFAEVVRGARDALDGRYKLLVSVTRAGEQPSADDVAGLLSLRPAGMLVDAPVPGFLSDLPGRAAPIVLTDAPDVPDSVGFDLRPGVTRLVDHLAAAGHRTLAYLDSTSEVATFALRRHLLDEAARAAGVTVLDEVVRAVITVDDAARAAAAALPRWRAAGATAVVAAADTLAYGVLLAVREAGLAVPHDVAVAGFDDLPSSALVDPALTSVSLPGADLGRAAAARLIAAVEGRATPVVAPLPTRLVVRASTGGDS